MPARVLVVGGAGYIGSVCTRVLREAGFETVTYDNLSTGHVQAVHGPLVRGDVRDANALSAVFKAYPFDAVMHFAALINVGDSMSHPLAYYEVNVGGTLTLLMCMADAGVRSLVFSSTCAVYGDPHYLPLDEDHPLGAVSPYGRSKQMVEQVLSDCREREGFQVTTLRYFNAAGALPDGTLGESHSPETHLVPLALSAALGQRPPLSIFGDDYDTRDGTCIRDYVHVLDLAQAHRLALQRHLEGGRGRAYNVGTGQGTTVREVLAAVERVTGRPVPHQVAPRRPGDPAALHACADRIRADLGWEPRWTHIDRIVETAARWAERPRY